jgi:hypothetical protein
MVSWFNHIDRAKSTLEVVAVVRDYLATWDPSELGLLPEAVRPGRLRDEQDIDDLHGKLVEEYRGSRATGEALEALQKITSCVVRASIRLAELRQGAAPTGGSGSPSSGPTQSLTPREN